MRKVVVMVVLALLGTMGWFGSAAWADDSEWAGQPPADVTALFAGPALMRAQATLERMRVPGKADGATTLEELGSSALPDFSGEVTVEGITEVHMFSEDFVAGVGTDQPFVPTGKWVAAVVRDNKAVGTLSVWKPGGGSAELGGYDGDIELGRELRGLRFRVLVEDGPSGGYFVINPFSDTAKAIGDGAVRQLQGVSADVRSLQLVVAKRVALARGKDVASVESQFSGGFTSGVEWTAEVIWGTVVAILGLAGVVFLACWPRRAKGRN